MNFKNQILLITLLFMSEVAFATPPERQTPSKIINMEMPLITYHPALASVIDKISELKSELKEDPKKINKIIPIYFELLQYVEEHPTEKMPFTPQRSNNSYQTIEQFVLEELLTLAKEGIFERPELNLVCAGINAEVQELYEESKEFQNLSKLEKNLAKVIVSKERISILQLFVSYYLERGDLTKALYYITILEKLAQNPDLTPITRQKEFTEKAMASSVTNLPQEEGILPSVSKKNGKYELPVAFQKRRYYDGFQIHLHPEGFVLSDQHIITGYNFNAQKIWEVIGTFSSVIATKDSIITLGSEGLSVINPSNGKTKMTLSKERLGDYIPHPTVMEIDHKLFIPAIENNRAYSLLILDMEHPEKLKVLYLGDIFYLDRANKSPIGAHIQSHFVKWGHLLYLSNHSGFIFAVDIDQETLQAVFNESVNLSDMIVWKNYLFLAAAPGSTGFRTLNLISLLKHETAIIENFKEEMATPQWVGIGPKGPYAIEGFESGDFYRIFSHRGYFVAQSTQENTSSDNPPLFFKNFVYIPRRTTDHGNSIEISIHETLNLDERPVARALIPALPVNAPSQILGIHHDLVFVKVGDALRIYTFRPLDETYLNDLELSLNKLKDPHQKVSYLLPLMSEASLEVRHFIRKKLVNFGLVIAPDLLEALERGPHLRRGDIEEILEEILTDVFYIANPQEELSQEDFEALSKLLSWGIPRILDQKRRIQVLSFIEAKKTITPQELGFIKATLQDPEEALRAKAVQALIAVAQPETTPNKEELFNILFIHFEKEESPAIRMIFLFHQPSFPLTVQVKLLTAALGEKDMSLRSQYLSSLITFGKNHPEFKEEISETVVHHYHQELALEAKNVGLLTPQTPWEQRSEFQKYIEIRRIFIDRIEDLSASSRKKLLIAALKDTHIDIRRSTLEKLLDELKTSPGEEDIIAALKDCFESDDSIKMHAEWESASRWQIKGLRRDIQDKLALFPKEDQFSLLTTALGFQDKDYGYFRSETLTRLSFLAKEEGFKERVFGVVSDHFNHESKPSLRHLIVYQWGLESDLPQTQALLEKATEDENRAIQLLAQAFLNLSERK